MAHKGRALLSVYNKAGLESFAKYLVQRGYELVSTGGTYAKLVEEGIPVMKVDEVTGFPEILGGRVKTLHPNIHGGILARRTEEKDLGELNSHNIKPIDLVVCNLYPFNETIKKLNVTEAEVIANIDIGGVTLLRAAAKNFESVIVVTDPSDYQEITKHIETEISIDQRRKLALKAYRHTADYDTAISAWFEQRVKETNI